MQTNDKLNNANKKQMKKVSNINKVPQSTIKITTQKAQLTKEKQKTQPSIIKKSNVNTTTGFQPPSVHLTEKISLKNEIENLTSIYNALEFINENLDKTFTIQRTAAEKSLNDKTLLNLKLKEENFKLFSKLNNMNNITNIDEYFLNTYDNMMTIAPKVNNIIENMNDFVSNINYGLDRLYLNGNITCDENILRKVISTTSNDINEMVTSLKPKTEQINQMKEHYTELYNLLLTHKEKYNEISKLITSYKTNFLCDNIDKITQELSNENKLLLNSIIND